MIMTRVTTLLRVLLVVLLVGVVGAAGLLYIISLDLAAQFPEMAYLRVPSYVAVLAGVVPAVVAVGVVFDLLRLVDQGEAFSPRAVRLLGRVKLLAVITAGYLALGVVGVWVALLPLQSPSVLLAWTAAEVAVLFVLTLVTLLQRLCAAALELRQDVGLMV